MTGWLQKEWQLFETWLKGVAPAVLEFIKPVAQKITADEIAIAEAAVAEGFSTPGTGEVKMAAALTYFLAQTVAKQIPYLESQARVLIEIALQNAKVAA